MTEHRRRGRRSAAAVVAGALLATAAAGTGGAFAADGTGGVGNDGAGNGGSVAREAAGTGPSRTTVTLVTGDVVTVDTFPGGGQAVTPRPGPGRSAISFLRRTANGTTTVVPSDALKLLDSGALDPALFDVTGLIRQGYDDRRTPVLPLIVTYAAAPHEAGAARATVSGAAATGRELPSIQGQAVGERKADAGEFWRSVTAAPAPGARLAPGTEPGTLAPGMTRIWLDGRVRASLDQSVPRIGAPEAWSAGWTGAGVRTAVLDTGIDPAHPDLADAVVDSADFTENPNGTVDGDGHGTHVASIITGNGAASQGRYTGVAPDTRLLVGKVLDDSGYGSYSQIIAGMEWAVARQARVVNMSLGSGPSDGTDPMSLAVDALSASSGALFVVAAGNDGGEGTVSSPSTAASALSVGAVDADDRVADFSSRGPRSGDHAVKPEITAPGVAIAAARAAGTFRGEPIDDNYTRLGGTSMATPHVAGAAAILAQRHPDWTGAQLKDALVGSASPGPDTVFAQGSGRVDVAAAVTRTVSATPSTLSTYLRWPSTAPVTRTVTYRNDGDQPLVLDLAVAADPGAPLRLDTPRLTVAPHATADAVVTVDPGASATGTYGGVLTARDADGTVLVRTALGVYDEPELYDLRITATDRDGAPLDGGGVFVTNLETGEAYPTEIRGDVRTTRVPPGRYGVDAMIHTPADATHPRSWTLASRPDVAVTGDTSVTLDARAGLPAGLALDQDGTTVEHRRIGFSQRIGGQESGAEAYLYTADVGAYAVPVAVPGRPFAYRLSTFLGQRTAPGRPARHYNLVVGHDGGIPADPTLPVRTADLAVVDARFHGQGEPLTGTVSRLAGWGDGNFGGWFHDVTLPGATEEFFTAQPGLAWESVLQADRLYETRPAVAYPAGQRTVEEWNKAVGTPYVSLLRCGDDGLATIAPYTGPVPGHTASWDGAAGRVTLRRGGEVVAESDDLRFAYLPGMTAKKATYALRLEASRDEPGWRLGTSIDATWTFSSQRPAGECADEPAALPLVRVDGPFDLDNRAPADRPLALPVRVEGPNESPVQVRQFTTEVSYDGGRTWVSAPAVPGPHGYTVLAPPPRRGGDGFAALRTRLRDAHGNALNQTILRAYRVG
ncbi:S8 family serine peptidase [Yinghuangia sp. ASG 101]|uniref:S8 family peptidase n=1 Tax=Yinghuangia sp. ASG 101 TaxID=2896848 RepID=UPI001E5E421A|nr:S8 family serine peptidase [Yinghuangia sp. ASG 101]UGQ12808.1 S8 family serine peptidase [Yinghuangia sp. ASG 101]